jgi:hypothetical protein
MGLGSTKVFDLIEAQGRARRERQRLADGIDPLKVRQAERAALRAASAAAAAQAERTKIFEQCAEAYIAAHRSE